MKLNILEFLGFVFILEVGGIITMIVASFVNAFIEKKLSKIKYKEMLNLEAKLKKENEKRSKLSSEPIESDTIPDTGVDNRIKDYLEKIDNIDLSKDIDPNINLEEQILHQKTHKKE